MNRLPKHTRLEAAQDFRPAQAPVQSTKGYWALTDSPVQGPVGDPELRVRRAGVNTLGELSLGSREDGERRDSG